ncbi:hypothetical protein ACIPW5_06705 [Streptomyces sp. NPDC090077]|uniref:hypothetical protein n=1 Tax=Streptomyces sp. NPDC090077 TaxID=3365938 RepID=UPI00381473A3
MCEQPLLPVGFLVSGAVRVDRWAWQGDWLVICEACYLAGAPDPVTGLPRPAAARSTATASWSGDLVGRGEVMAPTPCAACGQVLVRRAEPLLEHVVCSPACRTSLTRTRNGYHGSGLACEGGCGRVVTTGRADSRYCTAACRQRAYRRRKTHGLQAQP